MTKRSIIVGVAVFGVSLAGLWSVCRWLEWANLYGLADQHMRGLPSIPFEEVWLKTADQKRIYAWWIPGLARTGVQNQKTILFCHGSGGNISYWIQKCANIRQLGVNQMIFDYRGYGRSEGRPTEKGTYLDADAAYQYVVDNRRISAQDVVIYGESLGGAVAIDLASRVKARALIVDGTFPSTLAMAKKIFPHLPAQWTLRYHYQSLSKAPKIKIPVLVLHNPHDPVIPVEFGRELFNAFPGPKQFSPYTGTHTPDFKDDVSYEQAIKNFLENL